jgi:hypothetical protein
MSDPVKLTTNLSNIIAHGLPQDVARAIAMVLFDCYNPLNNAYDKIIDFTLYDEDRYYGIYNTLYDYQLLTNSDLYNSIHVGETMQKIYTRDNEVDVFAISGKLYRGVYIDMLDELFGMSYDSTDPDEFYQIDYQDSVMNFMLDDESIVFILLGFCKQCIYDINHIKDAVKSPRVDINTDIEYLNILLFIAVKLLIMRP